MPWYSYRYSFHQPYCLTRKSISPCVVKLAKIDIGSVQFTRSVVSDSLWPHRLQHASLPCPLPTPGAYSHSCPLSWWCHPTISSSVIPFSSRLQSFPAFLSDESVLHIRWPKYWIFSFSINPSNEYLGLISLMIDWFDLLAVQGTLKMIGYLHKYLYP